MSTFLQVFECGEPSARDMVIIKPWAESHSKGILYKSHIIPWEVIFKASDYDSWIAVIDDKGRHDLNYIFCDPFSPHPNNVWVEFKGGKSVQLWGEKDPVYFSNYGYIDMEKFRKEMKSNEK